MNFQFVTVRNGGGSSLTVNQGSQVQMPVGSRQISKMQVYIRQYKYKALFIQQICF